MTGTTFRPGAHDLETPFIFVPHGAPDPVEFKRKYPGWVSFPATFVPHLRPIPKWKIINGQRWPLDKKGRPWPKTRYGRPTCPFDELPPGFPAPGTQHELMRKLENPTLFFEGEPMPTVEEVLAIGERSRAERAAAAPPPPIEPQRAYDGDCMGPARDYLNAMKVVDQQLREFAAAVRQRELVRQSVSAEAASMTTEHEGAQASTAASETPPYNIAAASLPTSNRIMTDAAPDPVLEGRQYAAAPLALIPAAVEVAPAALAALGTLLGIGTAAVVLNEARKQPADVIPAGASVVHDEGSENPDNNSSPQGVTDHGLQRQDEAGTDPSRDVGDPNRVVHQGRQYTDTETGNTIYVDGNRVVVIGPDGKRLT